MDQSLLVNYNSSVYLRLNQVICPLRRECFYLKLIDLVYFVDESFYQIFETQKLKFVKNNLSAESFYYGLETFFQLFLSCEQ